MKKLLFMTVAICIIILGACSGGSDAAKTVKDMYKAAEENDPKTFTKIMAHFDGDGHSMDRWMSEISDIAMEAGGVSKMDIKVLDKEQLKNEVVKNLDHEYGKDWYLVTAGKDFAWVVKEVDGNYYVMYGDDYRKEDFFK